MGYVTNPDGVADAAYINAGAYEIEVAGVRLPALRLVATVLRPEERSE